MVNVPIPHNFKQSGKKPSMESKPINQEKKRSEKSRTGKTNRSIHTIERLQFEMMISELSNSFINLPSEKIDQKINSALRRVTEFIGFDRASLAQVTKDGHFVNLHIWSKPGITIPERYIVEQRYPQMFAILKKNQDPISIPDLGNPPIEVAKDALKLYQLEIKSLILTPLIVGGMLLGILASTAVRTRQTISFELVHRFKMLGEIFANALMRKKYEESLCKAFEEIKQLKDQLESECTYLQEEIKLDHNFPNVIGQSKSIQKVLYQIKQVAPTDTTVLILGESGTGKELIARSLHHVSLRNERPLIKVDCASLPTNLIENELFGHEKGAYTGASERKIGRLELADKGTVFLDEIGEMPMEVQSKLLRVIQESAFERLGGTHTIQVDVRIIAATNRNLEEEASKRRFRQDLWYRLNVFPIIIPPLRERKDDIPLLVEWIVRQSGKKLGKKINKISTSAMGILQNYSWPGNIRELENIITRALITTTGKTLKAESFKEIQSSRFTENERIMTLAEAERKQILMALKKTKWKIQGNSGAAELLGIRPSTLRDRMKKREITRPVVK